MSTHVGVTVWFSDADGDEQEDSFSYFGPVPGVGDIFAIATPSGEPSFTTAPDGEYFVKDRRFHFPARAWEILILRVDDYAEPEQTRDVSDEEEEE